MRPSAIVNFERLFLGSLVLGVIGLFLFLGAGDGFPLLEITVLAVTLLLVLLVSRKRSNPVRWILSAVTVIGVPLLLLPLVRGEPFDTAVALSIVSSALQLGGVALLWTASARSWFASDGRAAS